MSAPCRAVARFVESYLDGELDPSQTLEVETHTQQCRTCAERLMLDRAVRAGVRRAHATVKPSESFRDRARASMVAEKNRPEVKDLAASRPKRFWQTVAVAAAAAAAMLPLRSSWQRIFGGVSHDGDAAARASDMDVHAASMIGLDALIDEFVDWHARPLPPEITNAGDVQSFEPYVGVPVLPPALKPFGAHLLGGRILPVHDQKAAAMLQYTIRDGHRVSVYVYDPRRVALSPSHLHPWGMSTSDVQPVVYVGNVRGYSVATAQTRGVGYAVATDLDDEQSAELALAAAP